ncbi:MAG TPA: DNA replication protein DnaC [Clostridiales bacterium]|nr:DNA replication protein DnaC [Clostridiales bacterium]
MRPIHQLVKNEYQRLHRQSEMIAEERKIRLTNQIPELKSAFFELSQIGVKYSKEILKGSISAEEATKTTQTAFQKTDAKIKSLLAENSYPEDYLDTNYSCSTCQDTGFMQKNGPRCSCYAQIINHIIQNESDYKIFENQNFTKFNQYVYSDEENTSLYGIKKSPRGQILAIREKCYEFINHINKPETKNMLFIGNTGLGKTFMSNCVVVELLLREHSVYVTTAPSLFEITSGYMIDKEAYSDVYSYIKQCNLLVIDDLGTEKMTESRYAQLLSILEIRKNNDLSFPCKIIMVTNSSIKELYQMYTERVASRIAGDFSAFKFIGNDIRIIK